MESSDSVSYPLEQLYDLRSDPHETNNLAASPEHESRRAAMAAEVRTRWDFEALTEAVVASQRRRLFLREVNAIGRRPAWDFLPEDEASRHCLRGGEVYNEWCYSHIISLREDLRDHYPGP